MKGPLSSDTPFHCRRKIKTLQGKQMFTDLWDANTDFLRVRFFALLWIQTCLLWSFSHGVDLSNRGQWEQGDEDETVTFDLAHSDVPEQERRAKLWGLRNTFSFAWLQTFEQQTNNKQIEKIKAEEGNPRQSECCDLSQIYFSVWHFPHRHLRHYWKVIKHF